MHTPYTTGPEPAALAEARALLARHPAIDLHVDTVMRARTGDALATDERLHASPPKLDAGGFGGAVYAMWIPAALDRARGWTLCEAMMDGLRAARSIPTSRPLVLRPALEDARVLQDHLDRVSTLADWGAQYVTLTWNTGNRFAASCEDLRPGMGLTPLGRELVARLDDAGIATDVSHGSDTTVRDVLATAKVTPIASHSSARAVHDHPRNLSDELLRAIADRGGVVGLNLHRPFLGRATRRMGVEAAVAHVEHLWNVAGDAAVALGTDFDGIPEGPVDLPDAASLPTLIAALFARGHRPERMARLVRENAVRVRPAMAGGKVTA